MRIRENLGILKEEGIPIFSLVLKATWIFLKNPEIRKELKKAPEGYEVKPDYEIPKYESWMKVNNSDELYLRPTKSSESTAPEIVALAHKLGAYKLSDWDYANNVYRWVKNNVKLSLGGGTAVETLREGHAFCIQKSNLLIALCRAGGLKARYRATPSIELDQRMKDFVTELTRALELNESFGSILSDFLNILPGHELAEVQVDGRWIPADPTFQDELEAVAGYPISKLGDDPSNSWVGAYRKDFYYMEDGPRAMRPIFLYFKRYMGLRYKLEKVLDQSAEIGRKVLEEVGGIEKYNERFKGMRKYEGVRKEVGDIIGKVMENE